MKIAGIICEYNPFHFGHKYQLDLIRQDFDVAVCLMSGSFVQRGELALFDKWTRAKAAVLNGADLVLELPVCYCLAPAQDFAMGGVEILENTGVISALCFGSECADTEKLSAASKLMAAETPEISKKIQSLIKTGISFPKARAMAYAGAFDEELLSSPNNILGIEYISAIERISSKLIPVALPRKSVGHNDAEIDGIYASATKIRQLKKNGEDISSLTPFNFAGCETYDTDRLTDIFKYELITKGDEAFSAIRDTESGLAQRFLKYMDKETLSDILQEVKTKRYTLSRLKRIALLSILGLSGEYQSPKYIRVLAMNDKGRQILGDMRKKARLPIVNKVADFKDSSIEHDIRATNLAALCADRPVTQNRDFTTSPIYITETPE